MFEVPNAKRVRRDELYDDDSSPSGAESHGSDGVDEDAEVRARLNERLSKLLRLDLPASEAAPDRVTEPAVVEQQHEEAGEGEKAQEEEFEFRLFSTSARAAAPAKVILAASEDEDAELGEGGFTVPKRPMEYYLAGEPSAEQLGRYRHAALTAEDILLGARKRAWGLERPWRVVKITLPGKQSKGSSDPSKIKSGQSGDETEKSEKRKRPGKKRRIATRIKAKAEKEKREAEEKFKQSKEEHLLEKKKRLNRERKLKRRAKEREKKLAAQGQDGALPASEPADSGSESG